MKSASTPATGSVVKQKDRVWTTLRKTGIAITKALAWIGRQVFSHPNVLAYAGLLIVCAFFPLLAVFFLGCLLCYSYWESGKK
jgi:hypothetical protein